MPHAERRCRNRVMTPPVIINIPSGRRRNSHMALKIVLTSRTTKLAISKYSPLQSILVHAKKCEAAVENTYLDGFSDEK
ncbi:hypothetical protein BDV09DRAFT_180189 [Aspergillus tetrazonus]